MKTSQQCTTIWPALAATTLIIAIILTAVSCTGSGEEKSSSPAEEKAFPVTVRQVTPVPFTATLQLTGYVRSLEDVIVSTEEGGVVRQWLLEKGSPVSRGTVLAILNDDILRPQYEAANAQYQLAQLNFEKQSKVLEEQGISEIQVKTSEFNRDAARAQAELAKARLERTRIKSPVNGILDDRLIDEGELAPPGTPFARIVNLDMMKVVISAPEVTGGILTRGTPVEVSVTAYGSEAFPGRISFVGSAVNPDNRTIPVEVMIRNPGRRLKPDMIARVKVFQATHRNAILAEEGVIQQLDASTFVVYIDEQGIARRRTVTLGGRTDGSVEILSGLKPGDRLIVSGTQNLYDGQKIDASESIGS
jgi:membrane fusion protein (multidrug efflux system)